MATLGVNVGVIRRFMEQHGWSERELALHMDLAYSYVNRVLGGKRRPGAKFVAGTLLIGLNIEEVFTIEK
ncbi:MAG: helix-turn-helix transcriptional regulator [Firmicutes bacterium]|nr:helix-turn-helix transcriptional regulator [Bacillota bacterium]